MKYSTLILILIICILGYLNDHQISLKKVISAKYEQTNQAPETYQQPVPSEPEPAPAQTNDALTNNDTLAAPPDKKHHSMDELINSTRR